MDIQQLRYFVCIAKYLNFTKAAEECFVAQTTISYQISELENELGFRLFNRDKKSVSLTGPGACFLEPAKELIKRAEYSVKLAQNVNANVSETLSVGYFGHICYSRIPQWLCAIRTEHPDLFVQLYQETQTKLRRLLEKGFLTVSFQRDMGRCRVLTGLKVSSCSRILGFLWSMTAIGPQKEIHQNGRTEK